MDHYNEKVSKADRGMSCFIFTCIIIVLSIPIGIPIVSDGYQCFFIELGKKVYREDRIEIGCRNLSEILTHQPMEVWGVD